MFGRHATKKLSAFAHGELTNDDATSVAQHITACARCRDEFDEIKFGIRLAESLPVRVAPASLWNEIEASLARETTRRTTASARDESSPARASWLVGWRRALAACSLVFLLLCGAALWLYRGATRTAWDVASLAGSPTVGRVRVHTRGRLALGEWLETDANSRAELSVANIGQVEVEPGTRLRLVETKLTEHRIELAHGRMSARIWAPPRLFFVDTPSAVAADLGCAYTLEVDDNGRGLLRVTAGRVALEAKGHESLVPAGASCATQPGASPGTPYFEDATPAFVAALTRFDFAEGGADALPVLLKEARTRDTLTLWHLLTRTSGADRIRVYERLAQLAPPPSNVTRDGVLSLDQRMLDAWKSALEPGWFDQACCNVKGAWHDFKGWLRKSTGGK